MASVNFNIRSEVDTSLLFSPEYLIRNQLVDIPLTGLNGETLTYETIEQYIRISTEQLENFLDLKIIKQKIEKETKDFIRQEFVEWGHIQSNYLINEMISLIGKMSFTKQIDYPDSWLSYKRDEEDLSKKLFIVPGQQVDESDFASIEAYSVIYTSQSLYMIGLSNADYIPNYWNLSYITGFNTIPEMIKNVISKYSAILCLSILGDITFGAGIANVSLGIDGVSQSVGTTQSAENSLYSARIRQYAGELKMELMTLKGKYKSGILTVL
jgi:hypothetical protein